MRNYPSSDSAQDLAASDRTSAWVFPATVLLVVTALMAPRSMQIVSALLAAIPVLLVLQHWHLVRLVPLPAILLGLVVFGVYIAFNALRSVDRTEALGKVLYFWLLASGGYVAAVAMTRLDASRLRRFAQAALVGVCAGALLLMIESLFGQPLKKVLFQVFPFLRVAPKHMRIEQDAVTAIWGYVLNRSLGVLCLALWPSLLMLRSYLSGPLRTAASLALAAVAAMAVFPSEHETSMLALIFSSVAFAGMWYAAPIMKKVILAGWLAATLLVVPIAIWSNSADLQTAKWIPETGRNRIILWGFTANEVRKAPLLGVGVASTKELDEQAAPKAERPSGYTYSMRTGRHSHSIFMQTWYELGALGAVLLSTVGYLILRSLSALPHAASAYGHAAFVSAVITGAFSWGMWQTWFMAAYAVWALLLVAALELSRRTGSA